MDSSRVANEFKDLCVEFEDLLVKEKEYAHNIQCPSMDTEPQPSIKPYKTPLHWVKKLIKAGIIVRLPTNEQALLISPNGFVIKDEKEEKLRLIYDLCQVNKGVKSDCSIFPTPNEVMQSLRLASKYLIKVDLLQEYHQIYISTSSRNLFCFTLEDTLYLYIRASMRYTESSYYFSHIIQKILEDIFEIWVQIDNLLTEAETMEEAINIFRKVLLICREKNTKLATHKQEFGKEVDFTGTQIGGPEGYHPTKAKINGILELP